MGNKISFWHLIYIAVLQLIAFDSIKGKVIPA